VRTTLEGQPGVESVDVDFDNKVAHLTVSGFFDPVKAAAALAEEGYGATVQ
jgi:copper chaperone CopZ